MAMGSDHVAPLDELKPEETDKSNAPENDVFRQVYTTLTDNQKALGDDIKKRAQALWDAMDKTIIGYHILSERGRLVDIGKTYLEIAVAMAVKGVFSEQE